MRGKFIKGITTGALIGAAAGMLIAPDLNRSTKKKIRRSRSRLSNAAEDIFDNVRHWID
ncbi:YtxH domain-containing protein [Clostridium arbusti]|uniref:YtxH domain-containing protein n=1 Tax=Clostridium arbusti TaxID=1137848 RepID=UPI0002890792|nr:YtxH domain-containing protein [Clostridium arbusti]